MGNLNFRCSCIYNVYENYRLAKNFDTTPMFGFIGMTVKAKVVEVYDGDTITIVFLYRGIIIKHRLRTEGYDSPELRPLRTIDHRDLHIECGQKARDYLSQLVLGKIVKIIFNDKNTDKYGRLLGTIYLRDNNSSGLSCFCSNDQSININQLMIDHGYGMPYNGGKKVEFTYQDLIRIKNAR